MSRLNQGHGIQRAISTWIFNVIYYPNFTDHYLHGHDHFWISGSSCSCHTCWVICQFGQAPLQLHILQSRCYLYDMFVISGAFISFLYFTNSLRFCSTLDETVDNLISISSEWILTAFKSVILRKY